MASRFWASPKLSWAMVILGLAMLHAGRIPSLPNQIEQWSHGMTHQHWLILGYLCAASVFSVAGLWRLSGKLGLPKFVSFLFVVFPLATIGIYLVWPLVERARSRR